MGDALIDMTGRRIGRLTVLGRVEDHVLRNGKRRPRWECLCDCGSRVLVVGQTLRARLRTGSESSCGCYRREQMSWVGQQNHQGSDIAYNTAHKRVRWARGRAKEYPCVDCGGVAHEWSYDHCDPNEMTQVIRRRNTYTPMRYSADVTHYQPRCRECHAIFDGRGRS